MVNEVRVFFYYFAHKELDEPAVANILRDTNVLSTKEYIKWDWKLILSLLQVSGGEKRKDSTVKMSGVRVGECEEV